MRDWRRTGKQRGTNRSRDVQIAAHKFRQANSAFDVQFAGALFEHIEAFELLSRVHENHLHHIRRQFRICFKQHRYSTSNDWGRNRRPAQDHDTFAAVRGSATCRNAQIRILIFQLIVWRSGAHDLISRRNQIRLDQIVVMFDAGKVSPIAACRSARTETRHGIIAAEVRAESVRSADGNR